MSRFLLVALLFHSTSFAAAPLCRTVLTHASQFDATRLATVYLKKKLTESQRTKTLRFLTVYGFTALGDISEKNFIVGLLPEAGPKLLSQLVGVSRITVGHDGKLDSWKGGIRARGPAPDNMDWWPVYRWQYRTEPITGVEYRPLKDIRKVAQEGGVTIVTSRSRPSKKADVEREEFLSGGKLLYSEDLPLRPGIVNLPGLVLHYAPLARGLEVRGELNPFQGEGNVHGEMDKVEEMRVFREHIPDLIAASENGDHIFEANPELEKLRKSVKKKLSEYLRGRRTMRNRVPVENELKQFAASFKAAANRLHPEGYFLKWAHDYATKEGNQQVTGDFSPSQVAAALLDMASYVERPTHARGFDQLIKEGLEEFSDSPEVILWNLLEGGKEVLVQSRLPIRRTEAANNMEFRVDVMQGRVVNSNFRMGLEYFPEEQAQAAAFVESLLKKLPVPYRHMSAGFDVVQLSDGTFRVIEANAGTNSSFLLPDVYPISANQALSRFLGKPTPLIKELENVSASGIEAQANYLRDVRKSETGAPVELSLPEVFWYFRDRHLQEWDAQRLASRRPITKPSVKLAQLAAASGEERNAYVQFLIGTARAYEEREKKRK